MPFLQTLGPFTQPMAIPALIAEPYTVAPFTQPMAAEVFPPPPGPPRGGGGVSGWAPCEPDECPEGTFWDEERQCCIPILADDVPRAASAAVGLAITGPTGYQLIAAMIGLLMPEQSAPGFSASRPESSEQLFKPDGQFWEEAPEDQILPDDVVRAASLAMGLTISRMDGYEMVAAKIGLLLPREDDSD